MSRRLVITASLLLSSCAPETTTSTPLSWLQANVGTARLDAAPYVYKLNDVDAEVAIAANIERLAPDVIALQEVLPDRICDELDDTDTGSCAASVRAEVPRQLDRLLPPSTWQVACDPRNGYECVGIRRDVGVIVGEYVTPPPVEIDQPCDDGFTVGRVDVEVANTTVRVLNGHPQSTNAACRAAQVDQLFALDDDDNIDHVVVSGDMNLDPFGFGLDEEDPSFDVWSSHVGDGKAFAYASGPAERQPPYPTTRVLFEAVLDHVAVRGGGGVCTTLGEAPSTSPLDDDVEAMDHRALSCALKLD